MTVSEKSKEILLNINQAAVKNLVDELARVAVENESLKAQLLEMKKKAADAPASHSD